MLGRNPSILRQKMMQKTRIFGRFWDPKNSDFPISTNFEQLPRGVTKLEKSKIGQNRLIWA